MAKLVTGPCGFKARLTRAEAPLDGFVYTLSWNYGGEVSAISATTNEEGLAKLKGTAIDEVMEEAMFRSVGRYVVKNLKVIGGDYND
jgi:hypothetical protein